MVFQKAGPGPLHTAIDKAISQGIVIICSTADDGNNRTPSALSAHPDTIAIAACDSGGKPLDFSVESGYQYMVPGKDILAGAVPFVDCKESISGSSVATAIAAGLASLVLSCLHVACNDKVALRKDERWALEKVKEYFDNMAVGETKEDHLYIKHWLFCGQDKNKNIMADKARDTATVEWIIAGYFSGKDVFD